MIAQLAMLAALATAPSVSRLSGMGGGEITVSAANVRYNFPKRRIDYTGNPVRLTRGDSTLVCKRLTALLDEASNQVQTATCEGDVRFDRADKTITCEKATYDEGAGKLTCEGDPVIKSGGMTANGRLLTYDLNQDEVAMEGVDGTVPAVDADRFQRQAQQHRKPSASPGGTK